MITPPEFPHPAWCRIDHTAPRPPQVTQAVHSAVVGEVFTADRSQSVLVELNDLGTGQGAHVTLGVYTDDGYESAALDGARCRTVAALLGHAADLLGDAR